MAASPTDIARAFSGHRFADAYAYLDVAVVWRLVGGPTLVGPDAVRDACEATLAALADATTVVDPLRVIDGGDTVVVDAIGTYSTDDGTSVVSSCDIYDFVDGRVTAITSYTVELDPEAGSPA